MNFIKPFQDWANIEELVKYFPEGIEFIDNNEDNNNNNDKKRNNFNEDLLIDDKYGLKDFLQDNYTNVFEKIFAKFVIPKDLIVLRHLNISDRTPDVILRLLLNTIRRVWLRDPKNHMYGLEDNLLTELFSKGSMRIKSFFNVIESLEREIVPETLMMIYSNILIKNKEIKYEFKQKIIKFIKQNKKDTALYLWFELCTCIDRFRGIELLSTNLKKEFAVRYSDFVNYPKIPAERILLFTRLKNNHYIPENFSDSEYYKCSMDSINHLEKNIYKDVVIMFFNLQQILDLLINFFVKNPKDKTQLDSSMIKFRDKIENAKIYYESLKTIEEFWESFFPNEKKEQLQQLRKQIIKFEKTKLEDVENEINLNKEILKNLPEAEQGKEFINSIFFRGIFNRYKKDKETVGYKLSLVHFKNLEKLGENNDLNVLKGELKQIIIDVADEKDNLLKGELEFIKKYFKFDENDKYKNFNIKTLKKNIQNLVKSKRKGGKTEIVKKDNIQNKEKIEKGPKIIDEVKEKLQETIQKEKEINKISEIKNLSNQLLFNFNISENSNVKNLYESFFNFYKNLYDIGEDLSKLTLEEITNDIIYFANKFFYLGKNFGIIDNNQMNEYKEDILLLHAFNFMMKIIGIFKKEKKNYEETFLAFKKLYNINQNNMIDVEALNNLLEALKDILPKYGTNYIYIEIYLTNLEMKCKKREILNYLLDKNNSKFYGDLFPILDNIFSNEIITKFNFKDTKSEHYFEFISELFKEVNDNCSNNEDGLGEMLFFYFESKIMNELTIKQEENQKYIEHIAEHFRNYVDFLEKKYNDMKKDNNFISLIYIIAFMKCYVYKIIKIIHENPNIITEPEYLFKNILKFRENNLALSPFRASIKLYILKLIIYYNGNFSDNKNLLLNKFCVEDLREKLNSNNKEFGFDFMFIPLQFKTSDEAYNSILKQFFNNNRIFENKAIIEEMNNNIDILFCLFANFHFSHYYNNIYFTTEEYKKIIQYFSDIKDNTFKDNKIIEKLFSYFIDLKDKTVYKDFKYFNYDQILSLLISTRFVINTISSKDAKSLFYNLFVNAKQTLNNNQKFFNEYYLKDFSIEINDNRNINCLTYTIIKYIIFSHIYFAFVLNLIKYDDIKKIISLKESEGEDAKKISDYLLEQIFKEFDFIKKTLMPLLGINNEIIFMNSIFKQIYQKLIDFQGGDDDEIIKRNEESIESAINTAIDNYSKSLKEYYKIEKSVILSNSDKNDNKDELFDIITEKSNFYNNKELINKNYPLLSYFTYSNYSVLNDDFKNQYFYFNYNNSEYPLISSVLSEDTIFKIIEYLPKLNTFINTVYNELNMRHKKEEIESKTIKDIFNNKFNEEMKTFNSLIETNDKLFDQNKKIDVNKKVFEIINLPGSSINYVYMKIIELYNKFLSKMKNANVNIFDEVIIQEAKENDYNINYVMKDNSVLKIKEKLVQLILLYSKRERKIKNETEVYEINVYDGGKIIYDFSLIENKLEEQFIFGKKKFSEKTKEFIYSTEIFKQENNIIKEFKEKYSLTSDENKNKLIEYIDNIKRQNEKNVLNLFYELFLVFKYTIQNEHDFKFNNLKDAIKYLELKQYELKELNIAINKLKDSLSMNNILIFYEIVENEAFNNLTEDIKNTIKDKGINIEENIKVDIENCLNENKIIKNDIIIPAMKKYILKNIKDKDNYLFNLNKLNNKDIWDMTVYENNNFKEEFNKLVELDKNENNVVNYLYSLIYNIEIEAGGQDPEPDPGNPFD